MSAPRCEWCPADLPTTVIVRDGRFCSRRCRQAAFRLRRRSAPAVSDGSSPARFCYADPPYPGLAARYYKGEASFGGEVDHAALVASLAGGGYAGWALSTSARALEDILPLVRDAEPLRPRRLCAWVKPHGVPSTSYGLHNAWEALIVVGGRRLRPGKRDFLSAQPARFGGELMGRKPLAFCAFLFDALGMLPGDELVDLFPGTGIVSTAWAERSRAVARAVNDTAPRGAGDTAAPADASPRTSATPFGRASFAPGELRRELVLALASPGAALSTWSERRALPP